MSNFTEYDARGTVVSLVKALDEGDVAIVETLFEGERDPEEWRMIAGQAVQLLWQYMDYVQSDFLSDVGACLRTGLDRLETEASTDWAKRWEPAWDEARGDEYESLSEAVRYESQISKRRPVERAEQLRRDKRRVYALQLEAQQRLGKATDEDRAIMELLLRDKDEDRGH